MDKDDGMNIDENNESLDISQDKNLKSKLRKSFIPHKKRVILQELEPISESNVLEDCSSFSLRRTTSLQNCSRVRKNQVRMAEDLNQLTFDEKTLCSNECNDSSHPETPPAVLRQRIIEGQEVREYLEKELSELQDFTTYEKQILAAENGLLQLQDENKELTEKNKELISEMEEMKKLNDSQKKLLDNLHCDLDDIKNKLNDSIVEKNNINGELEVLKRKYVDEQMEKQLLETKWKQREDDLKKSLEEAWKLLSVKEDRITKMNEKISALFSEREKFKNLDITFGGQDLPIKNEHNLVNIHQNITELFELSCYDVPEYQKPSNSEGKILLDESSLKMLQDREESQQNKEETNELENKVLSYEEIVKKNEDILKELQSNKLEFEKEVENYEIKLSKLQSEVENSHKTIVSKDEEIKILLQRISEHEEVICESKIQIDSMKNMISDYKNSISYKEEEINKFQNSILEYEANTKKNEAEINRLLEIISNYELIMENNEKKVEMLKNNSSKFSLVECCSQTDFEFLENYNEKVSILQNKIYEYEDAINKHLLDLNCIQNTTLDFERTVQKKEKEIDKLYEICAGYELTLNACENKVVSLGEKLIQQELILSRKLPTADVTLQTDIHLEMITTNEKLCLEEAIENYKQQTTVLENDVISLKKLSEVSDEKINSLQNKISDYEEDIHHNKEEKNQLQNKISVYEEIVKKNEDIVKQLQIKVLEFENDVEGYANKLCKLQSEVDDSHKITESKDEEIKMLLQKILEHEEVIFNYKETILNKEEEVKILSEKISLADEKIKINEEQINQFQNIILEYEGSIAKNSMEINRLLEVISNSELTIENYRKEIEILKNKSVIPIVEGCSQIDIGHDMTNSTIMSGVNFDRDGSFNKMNCSYANQNKFVDVQSYDTTFNITTLNSSAQLERSIFLSELPQTDCSLKEYDPLATIRESSFACSESDTTLTEEVAIETVALSPNSSSMISKYEQINNNSEIRSLITFLRNINCSVKSYDEVSQRLSEIKRMLDPQEDYVIHSFCLILECLLCRDIQNKKVWADKILLVNETKLSLQKIKDTVLDLKNSFFSLDSVTSENFDVINSQLKKLFLCNRELFSENGLLKEQLKVSMHAEEKLSVANELLRKDLESNLLLEKELQTMKECDKIINDKLKEKIDEDNQLHLLVEDIGKFLNPYLTFPSDSLFSKLKEIYILLESSSHNHGNFKNVGFLQDFKNVCAQNNLLKERLDISMPLVYNLKDDLTSLKSNISYLFEKFGYDYCGLCSKLSELHKKQEEETVINNELRDNIKNLTVENTTLKKELFDLKYLNENLKSSSEEYGILLEKYKNLNSILLEKENLLKDCVKTEEHVCYFVDSLKELYFMEEFHRINSSSKFTNKSDYVDFLLWLETFLKEVHEAYSCLLQSSQLHGHLSLYESIKEILQEKIELSESYHSLSTKFNCIKNSVNLCSSDAKYIKSSLKDLSLNFLDSKKIFSQDFLIMSEGIQNSLLALQQLENDKNNLKMSYDIIERKNCELVESLKDKENQLQLIKANVEEHINRNDELSRQTEYLESNNVKLESVVAKFENEVSDYKTMCQSLEEKNIEIKEENESLKDKLQQYGNLEEYKLLVADQVKLNELQNILRNICKGVDQSFSDNDAKIFDGEFSFLQKILYDLLEDRKKFLELKIQYDDFVAERNDLIRQNESLSNIIKENTKNETLLRKEDLARNEKRVTEISKNIKEILKLLDYEESREIDYFDWEYIKDKICGYKLMLNKDNELKEQILSLESQLYDAQDFKTKFSKELHLLKPDLDISYLMTLSLADLQKTMIITIIEKEKDVIADYEMKLTSNTDKIHQLEEQDKRRDEWLREIEKENERLIGECKQIQYENDALKADIKSKVEQIFVLENRLKEQAHTEKMNENEESRNQLEIAVVEKQSLQLNLTSLNDKLKEKSQECEEMYSSLQRKAEVIFGLEKNLSQCTTENNVLEKEVQNLRESVKFHLSNFNDIKIAIEKDLVEYKLQIERLGMLPSGYQNVDYEKNFTPQEDVKSNLNDSNAAFEREANNIEELFNNLFVKLESLHLKINQLNIELKEQSDKFDEQIKNQTKYIGSLQKELDLVKKLNAELKCDTEVNDQDVLIEELNSKLNELGAQNIVLQNENLLLIKDKEAYDKLRIEFNEKLNSGSVCFKHDIEVIQNQLCAEQIEKKKLIKTIEEINLELNSVRSELDNMKETNNALLSENSEAQKLKIELVALQKELDNCQMIIKEKESKLSDCSNRLESEKEICASVKIELENAHQDLVTLKNEKEKLLNEFHKNLESERIECSQLRTEVNRIKEVNILLDCELQNIKKELEEKESQIKDINTEYHSVDSCPYKKELISIKIEFDDLTKTIEKERETFKLWKTNLEEDLHCKVLKIGDLEGELKKETQYYKELLTNNSELHYKIQESQEKFKRLEDKISMQRDVFMKEKSKSEIEIQNKDKILKELEEKLISVKQKCEQFSDDIITFLKKLSDIFKEDVSDLSVGLSLINSHYSEKIRIAEELKEVQEKADQLEEECEVLYKDIKYHENVVGNLFEKGKMQEETWQKEKEMQLTKISELSQKIEEQEQIICSLKTSVEKYERYLHALMEEKKKLESENTELHRNVIDLEKSLQSFKNEEISCMDSMKRELNHLKLELVNKNKTIAKLEMRLESEAQPFQKKADIAERKVEDLIKELRLLKQSQSLKQTSSVLTSPISGLDSSVHSLRAKEKIIEKLQEDIRQLIAEKSALKHLAQNRRIQIKELREQLGKKDMDGFHCD